MRPPASTEQPYAPTPTAAPFVSLGYRELGADLLYVRLVGYIGAYDSVPEDAAALAEGIEALDPYFRRIYEVGAIAMTDARRQPDQRLQLRAVALLERGARRFPTDWRMPKLAGQIYLSDLSTTDPAQRREWDERAMLLLESASRKPNAPGTAAVQAAIIGSRLGQRDRAITSLREILLLTSDRQARQQIIDQLANIAALDADEVAAELMAARKRFERQWKAERPALPPTFYVLLGPRVEPGFDLTDLATGGRDLIGSEGFERLEPLTDPADPAATPAPAP